MKIYTKTGDKGTTRLVDGTCVEKFNPRVEAYGTVDELNSYLGVMQNQMADLNFTPLRKDVEKIQHHLFMIGSLLATEKAAVFEKLNQVKDSHISFLEDSIDKMTAELPELKNFILPGGHPAASAAHYARTLCRRCERRTAEVSVKDERYVNVLIYLNRLSDYLFTLARFLNLKAGAGEIHWDKSHE